MADNLQCGTRLAASTSLKLLGDYLIIEPLPVKLSPVVAVSHHIKPLAGRVIAIGPGVYPKRYDHLEKHRRTCMWYSSRFQPTVVRVGDTVELGGMNYDGYSFEAFFWGEKECLICREADVIGISAYAKGPSGMAARGAA